MVTPRSFIPTSLLLLAAFAAHAAPVSGQAAATCAPRVVAHTPSKTWNEPLAREVTLRAGTITLGDALDRVASAAHLRFSYSAEVVPLDRRVCAWYEAAQLGDVLIDLLRGVSVDPVVAGSDRIVLAPDNNARAAQSDDPLPGPVYPLLPLIATATSTTPAAKTVSYARTFIDQRAVDQQSSVAKAMNANVPGMWAWQTPGGFTTTFSARGASSFGLSAPKVFIDGIEVANPLLMTQISPDNIESVEVIRGPQGAALYGADALSGVTNIITRHDWGASGTPRLRVRTGLAVSGSDYTGSPSIGQEQAATLQFGTRGRSGNLDFGIGSVGEYMPGAYARHVTGDGGFRVVGSRLMLTGTARVFAQNAGNPASIITEAAPASVSPLAMTQYTTGLRAVLQQNDQWTHSLVAGIDGYSLGDATRDSARTLSATDSLLHAWDGGLRTTLRYTGVAQLHDRKDFKGTLTFAAEHSGLHMAGSGYNQSRSANGVSVQLDGGLHNRLFFNGGVRIEHDDVNQASEGTAALPMVGASYVVGSKDANVRLRAAYGKSVHWPDMPRAPEYWEHARMIRPALAPEQQSGIETGVDIKLHDIGVQLTHYHQTASGLSQLVALQQSGRNAQQQVVNWATYILESVGQIANRGWEAQANVQRGPLSLTGTMALTDSRVQRVARDYTADLRAGDRMLAVPARTLSINAAWQAASWSTSITAARAYDWINYDRAALVSLAEQPVGAELRSYWQHYNGFTHLRASFTHTLSRGLTLQLTGDNLLGGQLGEPDNLTVVPGRTVSFGVRAAF